MHCQNPFIAKNLPNAEYKESFTWMVETTKLGSRPCGVMKTRTGLTWCAATLSKPTERQPTCMYFINLGTRRSNYGKARKWSRREAPYNMFSKAPVKRYVRKLQKLKMPKRTLTELTPKNRRNTLKVRYKKLNVLTSPTKEVQPGPSWTRSLDEKGPPAARFVLAVQRNVYSYGRNTLRGYWDNHP